MIEPDSRSSAVQQRMPVSGLMLQTTIAATPERIAEVFRRRANHLAKKNLRLKQFVPTFPALVICTNGERYAIELKELAEVLAFRDCTAVPGAPPTLRGVINLRGELRPVIDLGIVLSGKPSDEAGFTLILRREAAVKVDAIEELREVEQSCLARPSAESFSLGFISGTIQMLNMEAVLAAAFTSRGVTTT